MKILHYIPSIDKTSGGVGAYMQLLARNLGKLCELYVLTHKSDNELVLENCMLHYIPYKWLPWNNCKKEFLSILDDIHPDVFHTNCCWMPVSALTAIWAKSIGYKVVYTPHGMLEPYALKRHIYKKLPAKWLFQRRGISVCDLIHATAATERDNLIKLGWNKNIRIIPNCVQIDDITMKTSWTRKKNILFLSRVHPKKGVNFLIEAVAQLKDMLTGYTIIIAGAGENSYICELKSLAGKLGVLDMFVFIGPIFGDAKWKLYRDADVFVLPTYSENFGIVVPEALASGTPVITTYGTPWSELNNLQCGWCTEVGTKPLIGALEQFLSTSDADLEQMGKVGRIHVEKTYGSVSVSECFVDMYVEILGHKQ